MITSQPLRNPVNDALDLGALLRDTLNFRTTIIMNADLRTMDVGVRRFVAQLSRGDVGLFYFSGHGLEADGENYLLPVDFAAVSQADVKYQAYAANRVMDLMRDRGVRLSILILDACRNNPYRSWRGVGGGLARMSGEGHLLRLRPLPARRALLWYRYCKLARADNLNHSSPRTHQGRLVVQSGCVGD
jgi:hypothetical protein